LIELLVVIAIIAIIAGLLAGCGGGAGGNGVTGTTNPPSQTIDGPKPIGNKLSGVCFGPYLKGNPNAGSIVSEGDLRIYLSYVAANFTSCRSYGSTLGLEKFPAIAKELGLYVAAGCWLGPDLSANENEVKNLIANCRAGNVDIALVGSEVLQRGDLSEDQLLGYIARVKEAGVKVTTPDTWNTLVAHPRIIAACDEVWAHIYPFWEGISIDQSIARLQSDYNQIKAVSGGKKIVISETGWPSAGSANQAAMPSLQNLAKYFIDFVSWANAENVDFYYFAMFDEPWKTEPGLVGPHWGLWDASMNLKAGCENGFKDNPYVPVEPVEPNLPFTYTPIDGVPEEVNALGKQICQEQRNVVTPGGNEWAPGYSSADQAAFERSDRLAQIVTRVTASQKFTAGVTSLRTLSASEQDRVLIAFATPLYPTWAMNGRIDSTGTTNAGYAVESKIATALTDAVKAAL
jgi:exo-beta-1,3-glucanase (GH17 family)